jgi:asparagine synthase (glutamine-hydrolysing)
LSIIDLSTGDQPIYNENRSVAVVFNGEIYNFHELARELEARGHTLATRSDTETIVHAYEDFGLECVKRLRGMFAFALWDESRRRLVLARDRAGKKPLYYHVDGERIVFASEIKALLKDPSIKRRISVEGLSDYFTFGNIPAPGTVFQDIYQIPPAHLLVWEGGRVSLHEYWDVVFDPTGPATPDAASEAFSALFDEAVRMRMIADVPLGAFLSGGIDSSAVVASMARQSPRPVVTTCVGFAERTHSEIDHARSVARALGTEHTSSWSARRDRGSAAAGLAPGPAFADSSALPTYTSGPRASASRWPCPATVATSLRRLPAPPAFTGSSRAAR